MLKQARPQTVFAQPASYCYANFETPGIESKKVVSPPLVAEDQPPMKLIELRQECFVHQLRSKLAVVGFARHLEVLREVLA